MNFDQTPEFKKDLKRLVKKWRSLPSDLQAAQLTIADIYTDMEQHELFVQKFFDGKRATRLTFTDTYEVVKMRLDVADLGTKDAVRVIFIAKIAHGTVTFIELFAKNDKDREDQNRIKKYL